MRGFQQVKEGLQVEFQSQYGFSSPIKISCSSKLMRKSGDTKKGERAKKKGKEKAWGDKIVLPGR